MTLPWEDDPELPSPGDSIVLYDGAGRRTFLGFVVRPYVRGGRWRVALATESGETEDVAVGDLTWIEPPG